MWEHIKDYIAIPDCKDRNLYRIRARNFSVGVFSKDTCSFFGIREKFSRTYIDDEYHWDFDPRHGTAKPIEELSEELPTEIKSSRDLGSECQDCHKLCAYIPWPEGGEREITLEGGGKMTVSGEWKHLEESDCKEVNPVSIYNDALDKWLREMEKKFPVER